MVVKQEPEIPRRPAETAVQATPERVRATPERVRVTPERVRGGASYVSNRACAASGLVHAACGEIELARPDDGDLERIERWLRRPEIRGPLGFPRAPSLRLLRGSRFPDLTGSTEPVELLAVHRRPSRDLAGFLVIYERRGVGVPHLELDLALAPEGAFSGPARVREIKTAVLAYLFVLRGARSVAWERRKRIAGERVGKSRGDDRFRRVGSPILIGRADFRRFLERRLASGGELPELVVETSAARRLGFGKERAS